MRPLFSYFFTASFEDQVRQQVSISNRFCPHQQHVRALSGVAGSQLQCQCADTFRDAGAFAFSLDGETLTQATTDVPRVHTFALTASDGARTFGFCRHWSQPLGFRRGPVQSNVACILSQYFWPSVFQEVLQVLEALLLAPLDPLAMKTGPSDWLLPSSPASQFLEALLETKTPPPGELFSVRKVISKHHTASAQPPIPEEGLLPANLLTVNMSPEIVPDSGLEHAHWGGKPQELFNDQSPSGSQTPFDVNNPFDPPNPSASESSSHRQSPPSFQSSPRDPSTPQSPTTSTSSFSSFHSFDAELPDLPFLEDADGLPRRDPSRDRASEASVSGRVDGWELVYCFERPWDVEGDPLVDASLEPLLRLVPPPLLVGLLAALLRERRIAVVGPSISDVSSTVFAACAVLHPFQWQHIFLPVLPEPFLHYLSAPMPFLVGVQSATWQKLQNNDVALGDIVVLDLGLGTFHTPFPDRKELPKDPAAALEAALKAAHSPSAARGAFLRFFLSLFGWYRRFIRFDQKGHVANPDSPFGGPSARCHLWFDHRTFADSARDKKTAAFLNGFQGSQMYEAFVREVLARASKCRSGDDPFSTEVRRLYNQSL